MTGDIAGGPGTIEAERKIYRAPLKSKYIKPDLSPDLLDGMEMLYKDYGKAVRYDPTDLPPRLPSNIIHFDSAVDQLELDKGLIFERRTIMLRSPR
jgi:hypothetical protein